MRESSPASRERPLRVAIIDRCVPLYRKGLYDVLMGWPDIEFTIVAAAKPVERIGTVPYPGPEAEVRSQGSGVRNQESGVREGNDDARLTPDACPLTPAPWRWIDAPGHLIPGMRGAGAWQWGAVKAGFSRRFDAIIMMANPNDPSLWLCALGARLTGKRLIMWTHGLIRRHSSLRRSILQVWFRLAHALAIYGHLGKVMCMQAGFMSERCHVCYNSLDYDDQRRLRDRITSEHIAQTKRELFGDSNAPVVISLSRLSAFKKIDLLIRAHARLVAEHPNVRLLIVGDGAERANLEALAASLGVRDSVKFIGECYDEDRLASLIAASDLAVTPGAIGLTVMHCLAYGVPCITHDDIFDQMPEFEAILPGKTGDFFRKDDVEDMARVSSDWLVPQSRKPRLAAECIRHIERFYTPAIQASVIVRALQGDAADDLFVAYQSRA